MPTPTIGGSIESISIRGRNLPVAADAEANIKLGGFENEVQPNGDGSARVVKTRVAWKVDGLQVECNHDRADGPFLQEIADGQTLEAFTITLASGHRYQGDGTITGELQWSTQSATASFTIEGQGSLTLQ